MRPLAFLSLALALACGTSASPDPAPLDTFYKPSGLAVYHPTASSGAHLLVASSNFDLRYALDDGGSLIAVDPGASANPAAARLVSGVRIGSYSGELAIADAVARSGAPECPALAESVAVVASRATTALYPVTIGADGTLRCDGCAVPLASGFYGDPLAVTVACTDTWARAYVGYLRSFDNNGWISEIDLVGHGVRSAEVTFGPVRGLAFDSERERLWMTALSSGGSSRLTWIELAGGCAIGPTEAQGGCHVATVSAAQLPLGAEFRSIALSSPASNVRADVRRAYVTARLYDTTSAGTAGGRNTDFGGMLLAVDLVENGTGGIDARWTKLADLGVGAADVRILPRAPTWTAGRRDVVAALDATTLTLFDDETGALRMFGIDPLTGAPVFGHEPWGIGVDPQPTAGVVRLYVGSVQENFVTPIDVPLDDVGAACIVSTSGDCLGVTVPTPGRIAGGTP